MIPSPSPSPPSPSSPAAPARPMAGSAALGPGGWLGILGGGQLGRMTVLAAARLGIRCHVFSPEAGGPAHQVATRETVAAFDDLEALARFAESVDVITFEFENIPAASVARLAGLRPTHPSGRVLETAQDRVLEKRFFNDLGIATAPWRPVAGPDDLAPALADLRAETGDGRAILKTTRLGYDGKGQVRLGPDSDPATAWAGLGGGPAILEGVVDFVAEVSVIVARTQAGETRCFAPTRNHHHRGILATSRVPSGLGAAQEDQARALANQAARALDLVGLLAVEMFVDREGRLLVNEMAPRPHNSGHWTLDACHTDQFEQLVRAVGGLPLGDPGRVLDVEMTNLIGAEVDAWPALLAEPGARLHLYGKADSRPGRKMGHVTRPLTPGGPESGGH